MDRLSKDNISHIHKVAEYMYRNAARFNQKPYDMYVLGLVHDIGKIGWDEEPDALGEEILCDFGSRYSHIVSCVRMTPSEYKESFYCFDSKIPKALVLLWLADVLIDEQGLDRTFSEYLTQISSIYGTNSKQYARALELVNWLEKYSE